MSFYQYEIIRCEHDVAENIIKKIKTLENGKYINNINVVKHNDNSLSIVSETFHGSPFYIIQEDNLLKGNYMICYESEDDVMIENTFSKPEWIMTVEVKYDKKTDRRYITFVRDYGKDITNQYF